VNILLRLSGALLLLSAPLLAEEEVPAKKSASAKAGGFTGATPRPRKSVASEKPTERFTTPAPKKAAEDDDAPATPRPKAEPTPAKKSSAGKGPSAKKSGGKDASEEEATSARPKADAEQSTATKPKSGKGTAGKKAGVKDTDEEESPVKKNHGTSAASAGKEPARKVTVSGDEPPPKTKAKGPDTGEGEGTKKNGDATASISRHGNDATGEGPAKVERAPAATLDPNELSEFASQPPRVQALLTAALELTKLNLTYTYGGADPSQGGMDCSGTIYYLLRSQGFNDVPRDSREQYVWARKKGTFYAVVSTKADSFEFQDLKPGDLMFWAGTYQLERDIPITHVMLYLGTEKKTKKRVMFGSSDGRSYNGIQRWGVSVFDFKMPKMDPGNPEKTRVDFIGYATIPRLHESAEPAPAVAEKAPEKAESTAASAEPSETVKPPVKKRASSGKARTGTAKKKEG
jgi:cell wall-associated NlpC family hydrolase